MEKIPTALEFLNEAQTNPSKGWTAHKVMIEFAKLHVEAALQEASVSAMAYEEKDRRGGVWCFVDEDSILNSYPLENIK